MLSLNGDWKFRWSPVAHGLDDVAADPDFDDAAWDAIPVPSHWVLPGTSATAREGSYGRPIYTNVQYPPRSIRRMYPTRTPQVIIAEPSSCRTGRRNGSCFALTAWSRFTASG
jgi:beta-galactosidase/beta-glucuronidase